MNAIYASLRHGRTALLLAVALLATAYPARLRGQAESGRIVGTVTDSTGAAIPSASITILNKATGLKLTANSNASGEVNIPAVPAGEYTATVTAQGFQTQTQLLTIVLTTSQTLNFTLKPGSESTTVEVTGAASLVNTSDPTLGETVEEKQITELPLNGRNALNLALLTPGTTTGTQVENGQDPAGRHGDTGGDVIAVNGTRPQANNFILDGVDNNDGLQNVILFFPPVDATQEFKVITNIAPAQYGRAGGALVISSIKSGTNHLHGSAFDFYRSDKWAANPNYEFPYNDLPAGPKPPYNRNQFGGSAGLPILKNKLFLFGDYEGTRFQQPAGSGYDTVPTALMRTGNFSELLNPTLASAGLTNGGPPVYTTAFPRCLPNSVTLNNNPTAYSVGQIYDPLTCAPFAGNIIPVNRLNPASVNYLNAFPLPTLTDRLVGNYFFQQNQVGKYNTFDTRLDWNASSSDLFFFRVSYDSTSQNQNSQLAQNGTAPLLNASGQENFLHGRGYDLGYTHTFSPHAVSEARIAYNRDDYGFLPPNFGTSVGAELGINDTTLGAAVNTGGPLTGGDGGQLTYTGDFGPYEVPQNVYEVTDTLSLTHGKHQLSVGGTLLRRVVNYYRPIEGKGGIFFSHELFTGYDISEYLVGGASQYQIGAQTGFFSNVNQEDALFAQDNWRVNKRLTLNLGLRYDLLTWPYEAHNQQSSFNVANGQVLEAGVDGVSRTIVNQDYLNFAPRVGFAYDLSGDGKTAIHGGYGIFYFPDYGGIDNQLGQNGPFSGNNFFLAQDGYCLTLTGQTAALQAPYSCAGYTSPAAVTTQLPLPATTATFNTANPPANIGGTAINVNNKHSRIQEYNLQMQQQITPRDVISAAYVGTFADRLSTFYTLTQYHIGATTLPYPNQDGGITYDDYNGSSNYNGLQLHYEHRSANLLATASYSWSHALDNTDSPYSGTPVAVLLYYDQAANYGNSSQDTRQIFSSSFVYTLPFGRGQRFGSGVNHAFDLLIGGWQVNDIVQLRTGLPVDIQAGGSSNETVTNRPDLVGTIRYPKKLDEWFDPSAFNYNVPSQPATDIPGNLVYTRVGTLGRDATYGPGYRDMDLGLQKNLHIAEGKQLELHGDAFNVTNTPSFANPNNLDFPNANFGVISGLHSTARRIQLAVRLVF
jgi:Carboxypeptidase regulatory-like domain/TonB dependent receptor